MIDLPGTGLNEFQLRKLDRATKAAPPLRVVANSAPPTWLHLIREAAITVKAGRLPAIEGKPHLSRFLPIDECHQTFRLEGCVTVKVTGQYWAQGTIIKVEYPFSPSAEEHVVRCLEEFFPHSAGRTVGLGAYEERAYIISRSDIAPKEMVAVPKWAGWFSAETVKGAC
jgi:hypothetical protein